VSIDGTEVYGRIPRGASRTHDVNGAANLASRRSADGGAQAGRGSRQCGMAGLHGLPSGQGGREMRELPDGALQQS
jgi:hypothetical protein